MKSCVFCDNDDANLSHLILVISTSDMFIIFMLGLNEFVCYVVVMKEFCSFHGPCCCTDSEMLIFEVSSSRLCFVFVVFLVSRLIFVIALL